jgi:hypothetical protein
MTHSPCVTSWEGLGGHNSVICIGKQTSKQGHTYGPISARSPLECTHKGQQQQFTNPHTMVFSFFTCQVIPHLHHVVCKGTAGSTVLISNSQATTPHHPHLTPELNACHAL